MKRLLTAALFALIAVLPAAAQVAGGSIAGTITDEQKAVLPGVTVTIQGSDRTQTAVTDEAGQFRFLNQPPGTYTVTVELPGFASVIREGIVVAVGRGVDLPIQMRLASVAETITVTGETPARRHQGHRHRHQLHHRRADQDSDLARSVRADAQRAGRARRSRQHRRQRNRPAVELRVEGHAPAGRQSGRWTASRSPTWRRPARRRRYFNFDNFEEIQVSTAGHDIKQRTGGMGLNLVVKRGTNSFSGDVRGYFDNDAHGMVERAGRAGGHRRRRPTTADHNKQISDYRLRRRRPDRHGQGVVLRLVLDAGRAPGAPRRRAGRPHAC